MSLWPQDKLAAAVKNARSVGLATLQQGKQQLEVDALARDMRNAAYLVLCDAGAGAPASAAPDAASVAAQKEAASIAADLLRSMRLGGGGTGALPIVHGKGAVGAEAAAGPSTAGGAQDAAGSAARVTD